MQKTIKTELDVLDQKERSENAFNISLLAGVTFLFLASVMFISHAMQIYNGVLLMLLGSAFSFFGTWLCVSKRSDLGSLAVIMGVIVSSVGQVFVEKGVAVPTAIINLILVSSIALYTLPGKWIARITGFAFLISIATIIIDQYTIGIPPAASFQTEMNIALLFGVIYLFIIASRFTKFPLRTKLILGFLVISTAPLIVLGWLTYITSQDILQGQIKANLSESANSTSKSLENYLTEQVNRLTTEANLPDIIDYASRTESERKSTPLEQRTLNALKVFSKKDAFIISYTLIDKNGLAALDTFQANVNTLYRDEIFFNEPVKSQKPYISNVLFPEKFNDPIVYFAVPIKNANNHTIGVLLATYNAKFLQSKLQEAITSRSSKTEYTFLVDSVYFINLGHSSKPELLYKSYLSMDDIALFSLQERDILKQGNRTTLLASQPEIVAALQGVVQTSFQAPSWENNGELAESAASRVSTTPWVVVASQPVSSIADLAQDQTRATVIASVVIIFAAAIIALLISNFFTRPIFELTQVAEKVSAGDFTQKAVIKWEDEIGILGAALNRMTTEVQELIGTLEKRVADRTSDLKKATEQSEKRSRELQTIADISRQISTEKDVEKLLPLITQTVSERFGFYHVGIFLLNENKKFAVLRAANSPGGQAMLQRQHKLEVGQIGIVGNVTASGTPRIALDTGADAVYFNNPDLPETHSEMALPLFVRGDVIGALDVQSTERNAFTSSDIFNLSILADQISIAIDNARLIEETQRSLAESQSIFREYLAEAWQSKTASNVIGYYQTVTGGSVITKNAPNQVDPAVEDKNTLSIPIDLRGQTIGALNILLGKNKEGLTADQISIVRSIVERLGLALENARLFEETSSRASRERLVTDITTKIRATNNPQEMIKTAMEELKRALGASRVEVVPKKSSSLQEK